MTLGPALRASTVAIAVLLASRASATCTRTYAAVYDGSFRGLFYESVTTMVALPDGGLLVGGTHFTQGATLVRLDAQGRVDRAFADLSSNPAIFGVVETIVPSGPGFLVYGAFTDVMAWRSVGVFRIGLDGRIDLDSLPASWNHHLDSFVFPEPEPLPTQRRRTGLRTGAPLLFAANRADGVAFDPLAWPPDVLAWPIVPSVARFDARILLGPDATGTVAGAHARADGGWIVRGELSAPGGDPLLLWRTGPKAGAFRAIRASDLRADAGLAPRILASAVLADGTIVIGGNFTSVRGAVRRHIARLRPDGSLDR